MVKYRHVHVTTIYIYTVSNQNLQCTGMVNDGMKIQFNSTAVSHIDTYLRGSFHSLLFINM
jgi:hypothetical protein